MPDSEYHWQHPLLLYSSQPETWAGQQQAEEPPGLACKSLHELVLSSSFCLTHLIAACTLVTQPSQGQHPPQMLVMGKTQVPVTLVPLKVPVILLLGLSLCLC